MNMYLLISPAQKQIQYSSKWIKTVKCKLRVLYKPAIIKYSMIQFNYTNKNKYIFVSF